MRAIRWAGIVYLVALGGLGCGKDEDEDEMCPPPNLSIAGPDLRPDLRSVPACKLPDPEG